MIEFKCRGCSVTFRVSDDKVGGKGKCPRCGKAFIVPRPHSIEKANSSPSRQQKMNLKKAVEILGLPKKTTRREAVRAYRRLVKQFHPDTGTTKSARKFIEIVAAYEFLEQYVESKKAKVRMPVVRAQTDVTMPERPVFDLSYGNFVSGLEVATRESINLFHEEKDAFSTRLKNLMEVQISSYTSASEFRDRVQRDVNAVIERELRAFVERICRRSELVGQKFRAWVDQIRTSAYEIGLPQSMLEYLSRPGGLVLSGSFFLLLTSSAYLAMYMSPLPFFDKGPIPILAGVMATVLSGIIGLWGGKAIYTRSARKRGIHERAVLMSQVGMDSFQVGAIPVSNAWSSGERAGAAGAGIGALAIWIGVEPLTGAIAVGLAAFWGWATGKSLGKMQKKAKEDMWAALQPRLDDFFDAFVDKIVKLNDHRLQQMRKLYLKAFGPDDSSVLQRMNLPISEGGRLQPHTRLAGRTQGAQDTMSTRIVRKNVLLDRIREIVGGYSQSKLYLAPNIPEEKLANAVDSYAQGADPKQVLFLYDSTVFGSAKNGLCLTAACLFWRNDGEEAKRLDISEMRGIYARKAENFLGMPYVEFSGNHIGTTEKETADILARIIRSVKDKRKS